MFLRVGLITQRLQNRVTGLAGIVSGGSEYTALSSTFNTTTDVTLSKASNPQLLPRHRRVCVCVCAFTAVCVHFGWVKCRAQIPSMG